jgi:ABC-2 type transport system permease protein
LNHLAALLRIRTTEAGRRTLEAVSSERFKIYVVLFIGGLIWASVTIGLIKGLGILNVFPGFKDLVISYLLSMFFFVVMIMLFFSSAIVSYGAFFGGTEIPFLLAGPSPSGAIYIYRLFFALLFSAWAVMIMGLPVVVAYGVDMQLAWSFYIAALAAMPPFLVLTAGVGGLAALILARYVGRYRRSLVSVLVILCALGAFYAAMQWPAAVDTNRSFSDEWMFRILGWFSFARSPWYPSTWIMKCIEAAAAGDWSNYGLYMYALCAASLVVITGGRVLAEFLFRDAYEVASTASVRERAKLNFTLWRIMNIFAFGNRRRTAFFYKDTVGFIRDPLQWGQAAVFLGLILVYFVGLRKFGRSDMFLNWRLVTVTLSFLSVALTMSTFTTRFAFPLVSMELRVPWGIIGGTGREEMVMSKFAWTAWGSSIASVGVLLVGAFNMAVGVQASIVMLAAALGVSVALSAVAVGMGTLFPEPTRRSPSEMVSSFGGTLTLVVSLLTVAAFTAALVPALKGWLPMTLTAAKRVPVPQTTGSWLTVSMEALALGTLGAVFAVFIMWLAKRSARKLEW